MHIVRCKTKTIRKEEIKIEKEEWKSIEGYPNYAVSNFGRVKNVTTGRVMQGASDKDGYNTVCLSKGKGQKSFRTHRLVAIAFIPNPDNKPQVNHLDEVKTNNHVSNLEWATSRENNIYGSRIAKATEKTKNGILSHPVLQYNLEGILIKEWPSIAEASRHGFSKGNISNCIKGRSKTHKSFIWKLKEEKQSC